MSHQRLSNLFKSHFEEQCPKCHGSTWVINEDGATRCPCFSESRSAELYARSRIPDDYSACSLDSFQPRNDSQKTARSAAVRFCEKYVTGEYLGRGILFRGSIGVGKTHLAVGILKRMIDAGFRVGFINFVHLIERIREGMDKRIEQPEWTGFQFLSNCHVVVVDELGAARPTDFVFDKLYDVINGCFERRISVIFTTNLLDIPRIGSAPAIPEEAKEIRATNRPPTPRLDVQGGFTLAERVTERLNSRILFRCDDITITGSDYRLRNIKKQSPPRGSTL